MINLKNLYLCAILNFLILFNYYLFFLNIDILKITFILFIFIIIIFYIFSSKEDFISKIFILIIFFICIGSPLNDWDGKYIWIFHAKRIFYNNNLYIQLDNFMPWTHNDYPVLIPSLSASIANFFHIWNDNIPKISSAVMISIPIIFINSFIKNKLKKIVLFCFFLWVTEKTFLSASVDDILSFYTLCSFLVIYFLFFKEEYFKKNKKLFFCLSYTLITLTTLIKNEGLVIIAILMLSAIIIKRFILNQKINSSIYLVFFLSLFPILIWKFICYNAGIYNDIISADNVKNITHRFLDLRNHWNIFNYMTLNKSILLPILLFVAINFNKLRITYSKEEFLIYKTKLKESICLLYVIFFSFLYYLIIYFIYLLTPNDLIWHLSTSAYRVVMPIGIILIFYTIINMGKNKLLR
jgi:hypothetical protein